MCTGVGDAPRLLSPPLKRTLLWRRHRCSWIQRSSANMWCTTIVGKKSHFPLRAGVSLSRAGGSWKQTVAQPASFWASVRSYQAAAVPRRRQPTCWWTCSTLSCRLPISHCRSQHEPGDAHAGQRRGGTVTSALQHASPRCCSMVALSRQL